MQVHVQRRDVHAYFLTLICMYPSVLVCMRMREYRDVYTLMRTRLYVVLSRVCLDMSL
jgi:hypothetical protein